MNLSVIIPFYHDAKYLNSCLASLELQNTPDLEVLLVDDCGDDGSYEIAKAWQKKCLETNAIAVQILRNDHNLGSSCSRNKALEQARGKYIMFLDADDYLKSGVIEKVFDRMESQQLDDLYFNAHSFYESLEAHRRVRENYDNRRSFDGVYTGKELFANMVNCGEFFPQGALRAYRREFLIENKLKFEEDNIHEDLLLLVQAMLISSRTSFLDEQIYMRRVHCDSKMGRRVRTIKNVAGHFETLLYFDNWMEKNSQTCDADFKHAYETFMETYARLCARDIGWFVSEAQLNEYIGSLNSCQTSKFFSLIIDPYLDDYKKNPNTSVLRKLQRYAILPFRGAKEIFLYIKERK